MMFHAKRWRLLMGISLAAFCGASGAAAPDGGPVFVFFDSGKPLLSSDATQTLDAQIQAAGREAHWHLTGFADRSGSATVNLRMSIARARSVEQYLIDHGVPAERLQVSGHGETAPVVPTEDGVREPQNRRVEIRIVR